MNQSRLVWLGGLLCGSVSWREGLKGCQCLLLGLGADSEHVFPPCDLLGCGPGAVWLT